MPSPTIFLPPAVERGLGGFCAMLQHHLAGDITAGEFKPLRAHWGVHAQRQEGEWMLRVKVPGGRLSLAQFIRAGEAAQASVAKAPLHLTTRQDIQYYGLKLWELPALMGRLEEAGLSSRGSGGDGVRNILVPADAGLGWGEAFDPYPHALALHRALSGRSDCFGLPRKFKIAFDAGSAGPAGRSEAWYHDIGLQARLDPRGGGGRGFLLSVGGGLGAQPRAGDIYSEFIPETEILSQVLAILAHFSAAGERANRRASRLKFLVMKEGLPRFSQAVETIRLARFKDAALELGAPGPAKAAPRQPASLESEEGYEEWLGANVRAQKEPGLHYALIQAPLGEISAAQVEGLGLWMGMEGLGEIRLGTDQNLLLPWIASSRLPALHAALKRLGLAGCHPGGVLDPASCPGTASCGRARLSTRSLATAISQRMMKRPDLKAAYDGLSLAVSGCVNGCGRHLLAALGLQGRAGGLGELPVPQYALHFGQAGPAPSPFKGAVAVLPARRVPMAVERLLEAWLDSRGEGEGFEAWAASLDPEEREALLGGLSRMDPQDRELFKDNGSDEPFRLAKLSASQC